MSSSRHPRIARVVALTLFAICMAPVLAQSAPWQQYFGANTAAGFSTEVWRTTVRTGYPRDANNAAISSSIDPERLDEVLAQHDWVHLQDGYNYRQQTDVDAFFNAVRTDHGAAWRANVQQLAVAMINGMRRNSAGGHRAYWELGNEIYAGQPGHDHRHVADSQQPALSASKLTIQRQPVPR
jgi:hypothetical protein